MAKSRSYKIIPSSLIAAGVLLVKFFFFSGTHITKFDGLEFGNSYTEARQNSHCNMSLPTGSEMVRNINAIKYSVCDDFSYAGSDHRTVFEFIDGKLSSIIISMDSDEWKKELPKLAKQYGKASRDVSALDVEALWHDIQGARIDVLFGKSDQIDYAIMQNQGGVMEHLIIRSPTQKKDFNRANSV